VARLLLTGATGFTGGEVFRQALADPAIERVTVLGRRPLGRAHAKLVEIVRGDFLDWAGLPLAEQDACIWCLGVSQAAVSREEYERITVEYAVAAAKAMFAARPGLRFCFVSGRGADVEEKPGPLHRRVKGRAERKLFELGGEVYSFRPAYIRATARSGPRADLARFLAPIGAAMAWWNADLAVDCDRLAACLLDVAKHGAGERVLENRAIRKSSSLSRA
jgi:uncharacterized protein YbjT (DUF2867 family)